MELSINVQSSMEALDLLRGYAVTADESKLSQVLRNMLSNALKSTPPGGSVAMEVLLETIGAKTTTSPVPISAPVLARPHAPIHTEQQGVQVCVQGTRVVVVRVTDSGPGIAKVSQASVRTRPNMTKYHSHRTTSASCSRRWYSSIRVSCREAKAAVSD